MWKAPWNRGSVKVLPQRAQRVHQESPLDPMRGRWGISSAENKELGVA